MFCGVCELSVTGCRFMIARGFGVKRRSGSDRDEPAHIGLRWLRRRCQGEKVSSGACFALNVNKGTGGSTGIDDIGGEGER